MAADTASTLDVYSDIFTRFLFIKHNYAISEFANFTRCRVVMIFPVNNIIFINHIIYYASGENFTYTQQ